MPWPRRLRHVNRSPASRPCVPMALSKGRPMRKPIAITIIIAIAAALAVLAPTAAPAQEPKFLSGVTILDAVVDTDYPYFATVTVSVTCLMDIPSPGYV